MADLVNNLGGPTGFGTGVLNRTDDGSTARIDISSLFPSGINLYGHYYTSLYVNNNGNITFSSALADYTPTSIGAGFSSPIIAPFWADVDTRGSTTTATGGNTAGTNLVYYNLDQTNKTITITWDDVGYYAYGTKKDAFQLQLVSHGTSATGINLIYQTVQWTTGDASGGSNGLSGQLARVGFSAGDGVHYYELPASANQAALLALPSTTGNTGIVGEWQFYSDDTGIYSVVAPPQPAAPSIAQENAAGYASTGNLTVSGTAQAYATVTVLDGISHVGTTAASAAGTYSLTLGSALADASHAITVTATDSYGNTSAQSATNTVIIDTAAPVVAITSAAVTTNQAAQTIRGTMSDLHPGATVSIFDNGAPTALATATVVNGAWSTSVTLSGQGSHSLVARDTDLAGNTGSSAAVVDVLDITAPTLTVGESISGLTRLTSDIISGTVSDAYGIASVQVKDGATLLGNATITGGTWSFTVSGLAQGSHSFTAIATDNAGNQTSLAAGAALLVDTSAPTLTAAESISGLTRQTSTVISGTVSDTNGVASVQVKDGATVLGRATITGGSWSYTAEGLSDGSHSFTAMAIDTAGNASAAISAGAALTVDTTAPTLTAGETVSGLTSAASAVISGSLGDANGVASVQVKDGGTVLGNATITGSSWSYSATGLSDGSHSFTATATDNAGNASAAISAGAAVTVDRVAPVVVITSAAATTNQAAQTIIGTVSDAHPGSTVLVYDNGAASPLGTATIAADGSWSASVTLAGQGNHGLVAKHTDAAGNAGSSAAVADVLDTVAPVVVITSAPVTTNQATQTIAGTVSDLRPGTTVALYDNGSLLQNNIAVSGGAWSASVSLPGQGSHSLVAQNTDTTGNTGSSAAVLDVLDTTAPTLTATESVAGWASLNAVTLSGTVGDNIALASMQVKDGTTLLGTASVSGGSWSYTAAGLAEGSHSFTALATDTAGNQTTVSAGAAVLVDRSAPALTVTESVSGLTNLNAVTLSGTVADAEAGATVQVKDGATLLGNATVTGTTWSYTAAGLADGSHSFTAIGTDPVGNATAAISAGAAVVVDTLAPVLAITSAAAIGNQATQTITGTVSDVHPGSTVSLYDNGSLLKSNIAVSNGSWSSSITLNPGSNSLVAKQTDAAGNTGSSAAVVDVLGLPPVVTLAAAPAADNATHAVLGTAAPGYGADALSVALTADAAFSSGSSIALSGGNLVYTPGLVTAAEAGSDVISYTVTDTITGAVTQETQTIALGNGPAPTVAITSGAVLTNSASQTLAGTVAGFQPGATVSLYDNGSLLGTAAVSGGTWSANVTLAGEGTHSLVAKNASAGGALGSSAAVVDTLDTVAPVVAITSAALNTNQPTQTITGTVSDLHAGSTVSVYDNGAAAPLATATVAADGSWSASVTLAGQGMHSLGARSTDQAGNTGTSAAMVDQLDTLAPVVVITAPASLANTAARIISGTVTDTQPGSTVSIFDNGGTTPIGTATIDASGAWSTTVTLPAEGSNSLEARNTDRAGNIGSSTAVVDVLDTAAPVVTIATSPVLTNQPTQTMAGTVSDLHPGSTVALFVDFVPAGTASVDATGHWSADVTLSGQGNHNVVAENIDQAGNPGFSAAVVDVLDTVEPVVTITSAAVTTKQAMQAISGTDSDPHLGSTVSVYDNGNVIGTATVEADGAWSTGVTLVGEGSHGLVAKAGDAAGNTGSSAAVVDVLDTTAPTLTASESFAGLTNLTTEILSGTVSDLNGVAKVEVYDGATDLGAATITAGAWSFTATGLSEGSHGFTAIATDTAGNVTAARSAGAAVLVDTAAPTLTGGTSVAGITNLTTDILSGTVSDLNGVAKVEVYDGATDLGAATLAAGAWSFIAAGLGEGSHSFTAIATDTAGNATAARSAGAAVTVDVTPPQVTITSAPVVTAAAVQTIAGTVSDLHPGSAVSIFDNGGDLALATATVLANGSWSTSVILPVTGLNSLVARTTDLAGNTGTSAAIVDVLGPPPVVTLAAHPSADNGNQAMLGTAVTAYLADALSVSLDVDADYASGSRLELVGNDLLYTPGLVTTAQIGTDSITFTVTDTVTGAQTTRTQSVTLSNGPAPTVSLSGAPIADNVTQADLGSFSGFHGHALTVALTDDATYGSGSRLDLVGGHLLYTPGLVTTAQAGADSLHYRVTDTVSGAFVTEAQTVVLNAGPNPVVTLASAPVAANAASATLGTVAAGWGHDPLAITLLSDGVFGTGSSLHLVGGTIVYTPGVVISNTAGADRLDYVVTDLVTGATTHETQLVQLATPSTTAVYLDGWNNAVGGPVAAMVASGAAGPNILGAPYGNATVLGTHLSETIIAQGWNNHVFGNGGNDVLHAGQGQATVAVNDFNGDNIVSGSQGLTAITLGSGNNTIQASGFNNSIRLGDGNNALGGPLGNSTVVVGNGDNHIALSGFGNLVTLGNGHNVVTAGLGNDTIHAGNGDLEMPLAGYNDVVFAGTGNHNLHGSLGNLFAQLGAGLNTVDAGGFGNQISVAGRSSVHAGAGGAQVSVTGMAEVWLAGWNNKVDGSAATDLTVHSGSGNDLYIAPAAGAGVEHIFGFNLGGGDQVQFRGVGQSAISFHVNGADLDLLVNGTTVAELVGLGGTTPQSLFDHHALVFA